MSGWSMFGQDGAIEFDESERATFQITTGNGDMGYIRHGEWLDCPEVFYRVGTYHDKKQNKTYPRPYLKWGCRKINLAHLHSLGEDLSDPAVKWRDIKLRFGVVFIKMDSYSSAGKTFTDYNRVSNIAEFTVLATPKYEDGELKVKFQFTR